MTVMAWVKIALAVAGLAGIGGAAWHYTRLDNKLDDCRDKVAAYELADTKGRGAAKVVAKAGTARRRAIVASKQTLTADEVNEWLRSPPY